MQSAVSCFLNTNNICWRSFSWSSISLPLLHFRTCLLYYSKSVPVSLFIKLLLTAAQVYRIQTLSRVGAAPRIFQVYKVSCLNIPGDIFDWTRPYQITLVFLVCLQLAGFFCLTSAVLWLNKVSRSVIIEFSGYTTLYRVAFIANIVVRICCTLAWPDRNSDYSFC